MPAQLKTALSAGVHALVALLVAVALAHGIDIGPHWSSIIDGVLISAGVAAYMALTHWLATRKGDGGFAPSARWLAKLLTLGAGALVPAPKPVPEIVAKLQAGAAARAAAAGKHAAGQQ